MRQLTRSRSSVFVVSCPALRAPTENVRNGENHEAIKRNAGLPDCQRKPGQPTVPDHWYLIAGEPMRKSCAILSHRALADMHRVSAAAHGKLCLAACRGRITGYYYQRHHGQVWMVTLCKGLKQARPLTMCPLILLQRKNARESVGEGLHFRCGHYITKTFSFCGTGTAGNMISGRKKLEFHQSQLSRYDYSNGCSRNPHPAIGQVLFHPQSN